MNASASPASNLHAVILAGGRGERFWPVGRASRPKQFVDLFGGRPLIALAVDRLRGLVPPERVLVVTSRDLVPATRAALPQLAPDQILGEPVGRDTAAACATAAAWVRWRGGDSATMCILTADHLIAEPAAFRRTLRAASDIASRRDVMALIGIHPTHPATGYGYVELGGPVSGRGEPKGFRKVRRFVEKPNLGTAVTYLKSGRFVWNSGMFVWRTGVFREALLAFRPQLSGMMDRLAPHFGRRSLGAALDREYAQLDRISVDYAVMEKASNLVAVRGEFGWDDVGTWASAGAHFAQDADGNAVSGLARALAAHRNTIVNAGGDGHLVAVMGADDLVVVHTRDATLVCTREAADGLKALVRQLDGDAATSRFVR